MILLYSRRCLEVIITDLCECELKRPRKTEPLKWIIDKLHKEEKVPPHIISSMHGLNELSTYGAHPKDFDPEQVKPVLNNLAIIIKWYLKYKKTDKDVIEKQTEVTRKEVKSTGDKKEKRAIPNNMLVSLFLGLLAMIVVVVLFSTNIISGSKLTKELEKSIAVLPFINESPVDSNKHFINGIMEEVLNNLQTIKDFRVLSRTSTDQYQGTEKPTVPEIAKELGVNYIVEGSGQIYGNNFRLRVQLIKAKGKETHLWGKSYAEEIREATDLFNIQNQIAQAIAEELKAIMTPEEKELIDKTPTANLDALYFYQKGNEELREFTSIRTNRLNPQTQITNRKALASAKKLFAKALEYDSTFALAYTGLGRVFWKGSKLDSVIILADKAISYDNQLSEAHFLRGVYYWNKLEHEKAIDAIEKALRFNPNSWEAYLYKGRFYQNKDHLKKIENLQTAASLNHGSELADIKYEISRAYRMAGFFEKSKDIALEVLKLDGDSIRYFTHLSAAELDLGNIEKALELRKRNYKMDSTNVRVLGQLIEIYGIMRNWEEMLKYTKKYFSTSEQEDFILLNLGYAYLKNGYKIEAEDCFSDLMSFCENTIRLNPQPWPSIYYQLASLNVIRGDKEKVYEYLNRYAQIQMPSINHVQSMASPWFDSIRTESEFKKIVLEMEARFQTEHERVRKWLVENNML